MLPSRGDGEGHQDEPRGLVPVADSLTVSQGALLTLAPKNNPWNLQNRNLRKGHRDIDVHRCFFGIALTVLPLGKVEMFSKIRIGKGTTDQKLC